MERYLNNDGLRIEAERAASARGHSLGKWDRRHSADDLHITLEATCRICGASVIIDNTPAPDGSRVSGVAVAVNCGED